MLIFPLIQIVGAASSQAYTAVQRGLFPSEDLVLLSSLFILCAAPGTVWYTIHPT